jgi:predicted nucleic acid-binding protein
MTKKLVFDTNVDIDFVNEKPQAIDLGPLLLENDCFISFVTKLELLGYSKITPNEETNILQFLSKVTILPMSEAIEAETIQIRRKTKLKLPDAIIAATAIVIGAELVSTDPHFLKCEYPALCIWQND